MKSIELYQDNLITEARYEMSELEKNILYMVIAQIKPEDPINKRYEVSLQKLGDHMGVGRMNHEWYKIATRKLVGRVLETNLPNGNLLQTTFASSVEYISGKGILEIELSPKIRPFYVELKQKFTKIQLHSALVLQSYYAKRIYEMLCMVKNMQNKFFVKEIVELKRMLGILDAKGNDKYAVYGMFKKRILDVAMTEINGHTDLNFRYEEIYGENSGRGRKPIVKIKFYVEQASTPLSANAEAMYQRLLSRFKLRQDQAGEIIATFSEVEINKRLYELELLISNGKVNSIGAYAAKMFGV